MAVSGLAITGFVVVHLLGNLSLYRASGDSFNLYAEKLESLGWLLTVAEVGLLGVFLLHIAMAVALKLNHRQARPESYQMLRSKKIEPRNNWASRNMIWSGLILAAFLIIHVRQFRFGPGAEAGYITQVQGEEVYDLHRLVVETLRQPHYAAFYFVAMLFLGFHLRHGFWSAFQSLGLTYPRWSIPLYTLGLVLAILLAGGFLFLPVWIYFDLGQFFVGGRL